MPGTRRRYGTEAVAYRMNHPEEFAKPVVATNATITSAYVTFRGTVDEISQVIKLIADVPALRHLPTDGGFPQIFAPEPKPKPRRRYSPRRKAEAKNE